MDDYEFGTYQDKNEIILPKDYEAAAWYHGNISDEECLSIVGGETWEKIKNLKKTNSGKQKAQKMKPGNENILGTFLRITQKQKNGKNDKPLNGSDSAINKVDCAVTSLRQEIEWYQGIRTALNFLDYLNSIASSGQSVS